MSFDYILNGIFGLIGLFSLPGNLCVAYALAKNGGWRKGCNSVCVCLSITNAVLVISLISVDVLQRFLYASEIGIDIWFHMLHVLNMALLTSSGQVVLVSLYCYRLVCQGPTRALTCAACLTLEAVVWAVSLSFYTVSLVVTYCDSDSMHHLRLFLLVGYPMLQCFLPVVLASVMFLRIWVRIRQMPNHGPSSDAGQNYYARQYLERRYTRLVLVLLAGMVASVVPYASESVSHISKDGTVNHHDELSQAVWDILRKIAHLLVMINTVVHVFVMFSSIKTRRMSMKRRDSRRKTNSHPLHATVPESTGVSYQAVQG